MLYLTCADPLQASVYVGPGMAGAISPRQVKALIEMQRRNEASCLRLRARAMLHLNCADLAGVGVRGSRHGRCYFAAAGQGAHQDYRSRSQDEAACHCSVGVISILCCMPGTAVPPRMGISRETAHLVHASREVLHMHHTAHHHRSCGRDGVLSAHALLSADNVPSKHMHAGCCAACGCYSQWRPG